MMGYNETCNVVERGTVRSGTKEQDKKDRIKETSRGEGGGKAGVERRLRGCDYVREDKDRTREA
jgi:hypothetical protein